MRVAIHILAKQSNDRVSHELDISTAGKATLLCGGVPFASCCTLESVCSTLRFMPVTLDSNETCGGDFDLDFLSCEGGVVREPCSETVIGTSGVAERLPCPFSDRNLATMLLVEARASA